LWPTTPINAFVRFEVPVLQEVACGGLSRSEQPLLLRIGQVEVGGLIDRAAKACMSAFDANTDSCCDPYAPVSPSVRRA
jgi:hypothetical protein